MKFFFALMLLGVMLTQCAVSSTGKFKNRNLFEEFVFRNIGGGLLQSLRFNFAP